MKTLAAIKFRETFGLPTDPALIEHASTDPVYSSDPYGVPLSPDEIAEMQRRVTVERAVWDAAAYGATQDDWAGYYFDQHDGGRPVFLFAGRLGSTAEGVASRVPAGVSARYETRDKSLAYLRDLQDRIFGDRELLAAEGIELTGLGTDVIANAVVVDVADAEVEVGASFAQKYGDAVRIREMEQATADACVDTEDCRPMKGGLFIFNQEVPEPENECTSGFVVRRYKDGAWPLALLTAGHCIAGHDVNTDWGHNRALSASAEFLGRSKWHTWGSRSVSEQVRQSDVGLIEIDVRSGNTPSTDNELFVYNGSNHIFDVVTYIPTNNQTTGSQACSYGSHSNGSHCGEILLIDKTHKSPAWNVTHWIRNTNEYDWNLILGDSGGPIYQVWGSDRAALGTHVHSTSGGGSSGYGWYTPYQVGQADYGTVTAADGHADSYYLCTDANC